MQKTEELQHFPPYAWYEDYYQRVISKVEKDIGEECDGFCLWMAQNAPELYVKIQESDTEVNSLWLSRGEQAAFKAVCKTWFLLVMDAHKGFVAWKAKQREALLNAGKQEVLL